MIDTGSRHVFGWRRRHPRSGRFVGLANFGEHPVSVDVRVLSPYGALETALSSERDLAVHNGQLRLPGLGFAWLAEP